jgi:uncharacterized membrane protein YdjX (TVP38/TMEM64 family)
MKSFAKVIISLLLTRSATAFSAPCYRCHVHSGVSRPSLTTKRTRLNMLSPDDISTMISSSAVPSELLPTGMLDSLRETVLKVATEGGPPILVLAVALADSIPLVPTQPISIVAGALFGLKLGLPAVVIGQAFATSFALLFGRYVLTNSEWNVFEQAAEGKDRSKLAKVLDELTSGLNSDDPRAVFLTILLARQSPVLPFSLGNYFIGAATQAPILPALAGTLVGCLPLNLIWVGAGAGGMAAVDLVKSNGLLAEGLETVGAVVTLSIVAFVVKTVMKVYGEDAESPVS